jgi:hypothetical protein
MNLQDIRFYQKIELEKPVLLAGWPGMGNVALGGIDYIRRKLNAIPFAEVDTSEFSAPSMVIVKGGVAKLPRPPKSIFYYNENPNIIFFESETQLPDIAGVNLMNKILDLAQELRITHIYTGAAFPLPISYKKQSFVYGVTNKKSLQSSLKSLGIKLMGRGQISGLNGLLLGYALQREIDATCFLATLPLYAVNFPNPKASKAIVEVLERILDFQIEMTELDSAIEEMDRKMALIEEKMKTTSISEEEKKLEPIKEEQISGEVPDYIMEKIEKLFEEAKTDKKKAYTLKEELDRWDLYKKYEDRFLDLFSDNH